MVRLENFRLTVFRAVAAQRSFRKAAEELFLTQSAVSQQVKALEEELGALLFDRAGTRIELTDSGRVLFKHAQRSQATLQKAEQELAALSGSLAGELTVGASTTIAQYLLPAMLGEFARQAPRLKIRMISGNTEEIVARVEAQQVQLGLIEGPARSQQVSAAPFLRDELALIVPAAHEWAEREAIDVEELPSTPLLLRERGSGTRTVIELALAKRGVKRGSLNVAMELDSTEAIKSAVEAGLGVGILSRWALVREARAGAAIRAVEIRNLRFERYFQMVERKGTRLEGVALEFKRFVQGRAAERAARQAKRPS